MLCGDSAGISATQTSNPVYLAALAHPSGKQRVLQAHVEASAGDADVCRERRTSGLKKRGTRREGSVKAEPSQTSVQVFKLQVGWESNDLRDLVFRGNRRSSGGGSRGRYSFISLYLSTTKAKCAE